MATSGHQASTSKASETEEVLVGDGEETIELPSKLVCHFFSFSYYSCCRFVKYGISFGTKNGILFSSNEYSIFSKHYSSNLHLRLQINSEDFLTGVLSLSTWNSLSTQTQQNLVVRTLFDLFTEPCTTGNVQYVVLRQTYLVTLATDLCYECNVLGSRRKGSFNVDTVQFTLLNSSIGTTYTRLSKSMIKIT